jgi:FkbM family methyltransferase
MPVHLLRRLTSSDHTSLLGRLIRLPLKLVPSGWVVRIPTGLNRGRRWICGSSIQRCWFGTYEFEKQDFIARMVKPGMTVWDIGANVGFYTLAFAQLVGPTGQVLAFEPLAANAAFLLRHLELNALTNVKVIQAALSDTADLLGFTATQNSSMGSLAGRDLPYLVPTLTPAAVLVALPGSIPQLLKVDIEGAEGAVLQAFRPILEQHSPDILLALHGPVQEEQCLRLLQDLGYSLFYLNGERVPAAGSLSSDEIFAMRRTSAR